MSSKTIAFFFTVLILILGGSASVFAGQPINDHANVSPIPLSKHQSFTQSQKVLQEDEQPTYEYKFDTEFTTNASEYRPGDLALVNSTASINGINGSVAWKLLTPLKEKVQDFGMDASYVFFDDPNFQNSSVSDWNNNTANPFDAVTIQKASASNALNLTTTDDTSVSVVESNIYDDINGTFDLSFYYSVPAGSDGKNNLTFSYFNGTQWVTENVTLPTAFNTQFANQFKLENIRIDSKANPSEPTLRFNLTHSKAQWLIRPLSISYAEPEIDLSDGETKTGTLEQIWVHGTSLGAQNHYRELVPVTYNISSPTTAAANAWANFEIPLPSQHVYLGDWLFDLMVTPVDQDGDELTAMHYFVPIRVTQDIEFNVEKLFVLRGLNATTDEPMFEEENGQKVFSPTDNITLVGSLQTNTTNEWLNAAYFSTLDGNILANSTGKSNIDLLWGNGTDDELGKESQLVGLNQEGETIAHGNGTSFNNTALYANTTWFLNYRIPNRGLFGEVDLELVLSFPSEVTTTGSNNNTYSEDYNISVSLDPITVQFLLNISEQNMPFDRTWVITEFMEGNFEVQTWHANQSLLNTTYAHENRTLDLEIAIPLEDLDLSVFVTKVGESTIAQEFALNLINEIFVFSGSLSANLDTKSNYELKIRWLDAEGTPEEVVTFKNGENVLTYPVRGTVTIELPTTKPVFRAGENVLIEFNLSIDQLNGKLTAGLQLYAQLDQSSINSLVIEEDGTYKVLETLDRNTTLGEHVFSIYKSSTNEKLGEITFNVLAPTVNPNDVQEVIPDYLIVVGSVLGLIVLATFGLGFVFVISRKT